MITHVIFKPADQNAVGALLNNSGIVFLTLCFITSVNEFFLISSSSPPQLSAQETFPCQLSSCTQHQTHKLLLYLLCFNIYLSLPSLPFHPSCHLCHLFPGYPHSHQLPGAHWDRVFQAGPVTLRRCRSDAALLSVWCQRAVQRRTGTDRLLPSTPTSSHL